MRSCHIYTLALAAAVFVGLAPQKLFAGSEIEPVVPEQIPLQPSEAEHIRALFFARLGNETALESEQGWVGSVPEPLWTRLYRAILPGRTRSGNVPKRFMPDARNIFRLVVYRVPLGEMNVFAGSASGQVPAEYLRDGSTVLHFVHPHNVEKIRDYDSKFQRAEETWYATPSSSTRSMYALNPDLGGQAGVIKLSLDVTTGGVRRVLKRDQLVRGVYNSSFYDLAYEQTAGILPSGRHWSYMPEYFSASPKDDSTGGWIARGLPAGVDLSKSTTYPFLALISAAGKDASGDTLFDRLFRVSGYPSRKEFAWELVSHILESYLLLTFRYGVPPEIHLQNGGIWTDNDTGRLVGVFIRDMDAITPHIYLQRHLGVQTRARLPSWGSPEDLRPWLANVYFTGSARYLKLMGLRRLVPFLGLSWLEQREIYKRVDAYILEFASREFGIRARSLRDVQAHVEKIYQAQTDEATRVEHRRLLNTEIRLQLSGGTEDSDAPPTRAASGSPLSCSLVFAN